MLLEKLGFDNISDRTFEFEEYRIYFFFNNPGKLSSIKHNIVNDLANELKDFDVDQYFENQPRVFDDYTHVALMWCKQTKSYCGMLASKSLNTPDFNFLYLWTAMLADRYQRTNAFKRLAQVFFNHVFIDPRHPFPNLIAAKTYNPVVYKLLRLLGTVHKKSMFYPGIGTDKDQDVMRIIAKKIIHCINPTLKFDSFTGKVFGGQASVAPDFFPRMDMSSDDIINSYFKEHLTRDDQILCIIRFDFGSEEEIKAFVRNRRI